MSIYLFLLVLGLILFSNCEVYYFSEVFSSQSSPNITFLKSVGLPDGNLLAIGNCEHNDDGFTTGALVMMNSTGGVVFQKTFFVQHDPRDFVLTFIAANDQNAYVTGYLGDEDFGEFFLLELDFYGNVTGSLFSDSTDAPASLIQSQGLSIFCESDGIVLLMGSWKNATEKEYFFMVRVDSYGEVVFNEYFSSDTISSVADFVFCGSDYYALGTSVWRDTNSMIQIWKVSLAGTIEGTYQYGEVGEFSRGISIKCVNSDYLSIFGQNSYASEDVLNMVFYHVSLEGAKIGEQRFETFSQVEEILPTRYMISDIVGNRFIVLGLNPLNEQSIHYELVGGRIHHFDLTGNLVSYYFEIPDLDNRLTYVPHQLMISNSPSSTFTIIGSYYSDDAVIWMYNLMHISSTTVTKWSCHIFREHRTESETKKVTFASFNSFKKKKNLSHGKLIAPKRPVIKTLPVSYFHFDFTFCWSCFSVMQNNPSVCNNHGRCVNFDECVCESSKYVDPTCDITCFNVSSNDESVCSKHGKCDEVDKCFCQFPYTGKKCSSSSQFVGYVVTVCVLLCFLCVMSICYFCIFLCAIFTFFLPLCLQKVIRKVNPSSSDSVIDFLEYLGVELNEGGGTNEKDALFSNIRTSVTANNVSYFLEEHEIFIDSGPKEKKKQESNDLKNSENENLTDVKIRGWSNVPNQDSHAFVTTENLRSSRKISSNGYGVMLVLPIQKNVKKSKPKQKRRNELSDDLSLLDSLVDKEFVMFEGMFDRRTKNRSGQGVQYHTPKFRSSDDIGIGMDNDLRTTEHEESDFDNDDYVLFKGGFKNDCRNGIGIEFSFVHPNDNNSPRNDKSNKNMKKSRNSKQKSKLLIEGVWKEGCIEDIYHFTKKLSSIDIINISQLIRTNKNSTSEKSIIDERRVTLNSVIPNLIVRQIHLSSSIRRDYSLLIFVNERKSILKIFESAKDNDQVDRSSKTDEMSSLLDSPAEKRKKIRYGLYGYVHPIIDPRICEVMIRNLTIIKVLEEQKRNKLIMGHIPDISIPASGRPGRTDDVYLKVLGWSGIGKNCEYFGYLTEPVHGSLEDYIRIGNRRNRKSRSRRKSKKSSSSTRKARKGKKGFDSISSISSDRSDMITNLTRVEDSSLTGLEEEEEIDEFHGLVEKTWTDLDILYHVSRMLEKMHEECEMVHMNMSPKNILFLNPGVLREDKVETIDELKEEELKLFGFEYSKSTKQFLFSPSSVLPRSSDSQSQVNEDSSSSSKKKSHNHNHNHNQGKLVFPSLFMDPQILYCSKRIISDLRTLDIYSFGLLVVSVLLKRQNPFFKIRKCAVCNKKFKKGKRLEADILNHVQDCKFIPYLDYHSMVKELGDIDLQWIIDLVQSCVSGETEKRPKMKQLVKILEMGRERWRAKYRKYISKKLKSSEDRRSKGEFGQRIREGIEFDTNKEVPDLDTSNSNNYND